eukprot:CAMPEP_0181086056 /NCGR_PEP_ID=MMETSP1071-20121207/5547_1 /TAXON_ID=35127 /ORGANISM="Thalassiosira sp., Strain NH16" /LENGTH=350 /DNA_ID=CAMNT_0023167875 /DNA_START=64 /DNA_END=1113 /DNA_ORIENTATION=-
MIAADKVPRCSHVLLLLASHLLGHRAHAFQSGISRVAVVRHSTAVQLSPRQLQFWEDVDDGLVDIEAFYEAKGQSMDRIHTFCSRARGDLPLPEPASPGHQPSEEHIDGLAASAFWDASSDEKSFPWAAELETNAHIIAEEFDQRLLQMAEDEDKKSSALFSGDSAWQSKVMGTGWSAFRLQRLGVWNVSNCAKFPKTYNLLKELDIPLAVRGVCFARQTPGSGVAPHTDGRNFILTSHLGLKIPAGCWIKVGEEERSWSEGKLTTLDTSFEHSTGNPSSEDRHVLIIDFWHPELNDAERAGLEYIYDLRNKFESGEVPFRQPRNEQPETAVDEGQGLGGLWKALTGGGN